MESKNMSCVNGPLFYMEQAIASWMPPYVHHMTGCVMQPYCNFSGFIKSLCEAGAMQQPKQTTNKTKEISLRLNPQMHEKEPNKRY